MATSPTQRTLKEMRAAGWTCQVVERWNPYAKVRQDLFGFGDIVAIHAETRTICLVQCTTIAHMAERLAKIQMEPRARTWHEAGGMIMVYGWAKKGPRGKRKTWQSKFNVVSGNTLIKPIDNAQQGE